MKRIAFIDLGSNSVRFVITEVADNGSYSLLYQQKESIRLSEGLSGNNLLTEEAMYRALQALKAFSQMAKTMNATLVKAIATAAVRQAENADQFIRRVEEETGISLHCISGLEEARLGFLGVINTIAVNDCILFDLGGASIEITLVKNRNIKKSTSIPLGALTLTEQFQKGKEMTPQEYSRMVRTIREQLKKEAWIKDVSLPVIGIGGTVRNLAKVKQRKDNYPLPKLHNYEMTPEDINTLLKDFKGKSLEERQNISGLSADRADIIIAGTAMIAELLSYTKAKQLLVSGCGLREGLFYDFYGEYFSRDPRLEDILLHSTKNFQRSLPTTDQAHINHISYLSDLLFTKLISLHGCKKRMRDLLQVAAILHDTGKTINYYSHSRHSAYIIINSPLYGLSHKEQAMCAFIAGWSHGINNSLTRSFSFSKLLSSEDVRDIKKISTLLALAEALDESHNQIVSSLSCKISGESVVFTLTTSTEGNHEVEDISLQTLQKQFKKYYGLNMIINWRPLKGSKGTVTK